MNAVPAAQARILVVEDEAAIRHLLRTTLELAGHVVHEAATSMVGLAFARGCRPDLYIIDLGLPDGDGLDLIRELRSWTSQPIVVLSARSQEAQKVQALDAGADDYVTKPFGVDELHARVRVALRHGMQRPPDGSKPLRLGDTEIDLVTRTVRRRGEIVRLSGTQWRLLQTLCRSPGRVVTSGQLLREVWGPGAAEHAHYLRIYIRQLRRRLEADPAHPRHILTETGVGYRLLTEEGGPQAAIERVGA